MSYGTFAINVVQMVMNVEVVVLWLYKSYCFHCELLLEAWHLPIHCSIVNAVR